MQKKALGKGLGALFIEPTDLEGGFHNREIEIGRIIPNKYQPRTQFDEGKLRELTDSVKKNGILQPVIVRRSHEGQFELIAGERRWRAAQAAGLERIPVIIKEATDEEVVILALIENIQREDLNAIEEARAYRRLIKEFAVSQEEIAAQTGKDRSTVANALRLLNLPLELQEEVRSSKLSVGHAKAILSIGRAADQIKVARRILQKGLTVRQTEKLIQQVQGGSQKKKSVSQPPLGVYEAVDRLRRHLGTQVSIKQRGSHGEIMIHYYELPDLDRIVDLILA